MSIDEGKLNLDVAGIEKEIKKRGWVFSKEGGSHRLFRHPKSDQVLAIPRHKGSIPPGTIHSILSKSASVREEVSVLPKLFDILSELQKKKADKREKVVLKQNTSKVTIHPPLKEAKADQVAKKVLTQADMSKAINFPEGVIGDPDAPSSLKDYAYQILQLRLEEEEYDEIMEEFEQADLIEEAIKVKKPVTARKAGIKKAMDAVKARGMIEGKQWHVDHPANHMNIVNAYMDTNHEEKEFGNHWYSDAHKLTKFLSKGTGHPIHTVAGVISNHSPQNGIYQNYHDAVRVLDKGEGIGGKGSGVMASEKQAHVDNRLFKGEHYNDVLKGKKTKAFAYLLEHGHQHDPSQPRVVIDRHAHSVLSGARITDNAFGMAGMKRKGRYEELEHHYLAASEHLERHHGIKVAPEQLQAATWAWRQRKNQEEENSRGTDRTARKSMSQERSWGEFAKQRFAGQKLPNVPGHGFKDKSAPEEEEYKPKKSTKDFEHEKNVDAMEPWKYDF